MAGAESRIRRVGHYETRHWKPDFTAPGGRKNRRAFSYEAFVPDAVGGASPSLAAEVVAHASEAERAVLALNLAPPALGDLEVLARRLLRAESVASSWIEGLRISQRRLARAELTGAENDVTARAVLGNVAAMENSVVLAASSKRFTVADVLTIHRTLMAQTSTPEDAGKLRVRQNWIGGTPYNPLNAAFVPPPHEFVKPLMDDLVRFIARDDLPPVIQAAIAHAQFETIHPFADGNGRVGRALIHVVLRRRGVASRFVPPVSLVLATNSGSYMGGLTAYRDGRLDEWVDVFARALASAARQSVELAEALRALQAEWRTRVGAPRRDSSATLLIERLPAHPVLTVESAAEILGRSKQAANEAVAALELAGVLKQTSLGRRNRAFEAVELVKLIDAFERQLAIPEDGGPARRPSPR
jgi:Fic family protein